MARELTPCGVGTGGYQRHLKAGEPACEACHRSRLAYQVKRRGGYKPRKLAPCGTPAAYQRHIKRGEDVCEECRRAYNAWQNEWRAQRKQQRIEQARAETSARQAAA
jgi:hypothetical protein